MFNLCDILKLIIDCFYKRAFPQANHVGNAHKRVFHIVPDLGEQLDAVNKKTLKRVFPIYPLSPKSFHFMFFKRTPSFNGSLSSTSPVVKTKFNISPLSLIIKCCLNPKNQPIGHLPRLASPSKVLWMRIRRLRHTHRGVLSTKLIPVHSPSNTCL